MNVQLTMGAANSCVPIVRVHLHAGVKWDTYWKMIWRHAKVSFDFFCVTTLLIQVNLRGFSITQPRTFSFVFTNSHIEKKIGQIWLKLGQLHEVMEEKFSMHEFTLKIMLFTHHTQKSFDAFTQIIFHFYAITQTSHNDGPYFSYIVLSLKTNEFIIDFVKYN